MKIYVASSWRNEFQQEVVRRLRVESHDVYDFKNPQGAGPGTGFAWASIDPDWRTWTPAQYLLALTHAKAQAGFESDERGMVRADACVLVLPAGRSAHVEFGWMLGRGQLGYVLLSEDGFDPDLMYLLTPHRNLCLTLDELVGKIREDEAGSRKTGGGVPAGRGSWASSRPNYDNIPKSLGSPASPPVMPHIVTTPRGDVAGEVAITGGVCNLEPFKPVFSVVAQLKGAAGGPPVGDEYRAYGLGGGAERARGTADWCRTVLTAEGYTPLDEAGRAALAKGRNLPDGELWVNMAALTAADEWFDTIKQYLP